MVGQIQKSIALDYAWFRNDASRLPEPQEKYLRPAQGCIEMKRDYARTRRPDTCRPIAFSQTSRTGEGSS